MNLKYLFRVDFTDGSSLKQTKEDVSATDPQRSAFYDVVNSGKQVRTFSLHRFLESWTVDLISGMFYHNNVPFQLEENPEGERELVFFRQHQHDTTPEGVETDHRVTYFLGYKVEDKQYLVGIK